MLVLLPPAVGFPIGEMSLRVGQFVVVWKGEMEGVVEEKKNGRWRLSWRDLKLGKWDMPG